MSETVKPDLPAHLADPPAVQRWMEPATPGEGGKAILREIATAYYRTPEHDLPRRAALTRASAAAAQHYTPAIERDRAGRPGVTPERVGQLFAHGLDMHHLADGERRALRPALDRVARDGVSEGELRLILAEDRRAQDRADFGHADTDRKEALAAITATERGRADLAAARAYARSVPGLADFLNRGAGNSGRLVPVLARLARAKGLAR